MLGNRHELDVREAHLAGILRQRMREIAIAEDLPGIRGIAPPRSQVNLVSGYRRVERVGARARRHPRPVFPVVIQRPQARGRSRRRLAAERERIALVDPQAMPRLDAIFVALALRDTGYPIFPDARAVGSRVKRMGIAPPFIEVADHRYPHRVGRPHGEARRLSAADDVRAELVVERVMPALPEQMDVVLGQQRPYGAMRRFAGSAFLDRFAMFQLSRFAAAALLATRPSANGVAGSGSISPDTNPWLA